MVIVKNMKLDFLASMFLYAAPMIVKICTLLTVVSFQYQRSRAEFLEAKIPCYVVVYGRCAAVLAG